MKQRITAREWEELKALGRMERIGQERKDWGTWAVCANFGFKGTVDDLFPSGKVGKPQTADEMFAVMSSLVAKNGNQHSNPSD